MKGEEGTIPKHTYKTNQITRKPMYLPHRWQYVRLVYQLRQLIAASCILSSKIDRFIRSIADGDVELVRNHSYCGM